MYVIMVYDIKEKRVSKVLEICRKYLNWVQNSVFEGEISNGGLFKLKAELKKIIKPEEDSIVIYILKTRLYTSREILGVEKNPESNIL